MKNNTKRAIGWRLRLLLFTVAASAILLYLFTVPLQESLAQSAVSKQTEISVESEPEDSVHFQSGDPQDSQKEILSSKSQESELPPAPASLPPSGQSIVGGFVGGISGEAPAQPPPPGRSIPKEIGAGVVGGFPGGVVGEANAPVQPPPPPQATAPEAEKVPVPPQAGMKQANGKLLMNFKNLDLVTFIENVSPILELTPLVIDSAVKGTVTVHSSTPMTKEEALALFNLILKKNNASLIHQNGIYQVEPISSTQKAVVVDPNQFIAHENETLKTVSKSVSVSIESSREQNFEISRLDGYVLVLEGDNGTYRSTPILTDGEKGHCRFNQLIPVGEYTLEMSAFKIATLITIPDLPQRTLTLKLRMAKNMTITFQ